MQTELGKWMRDNALGVSVFGINTVFPLGPKVDSWEEHLSQGNSVPGKRSGVRQAPAVEADGPSNHGTFDAPPDVWRGIFFVGCSCICAGCPFPLRVPPGRTDGLGVGGGEDMWAQGF